MSGKKIYTVYIHICKENNKTYVGITSQEPKRRWKKGKGYKGCIYFNYAIEKYGWDNFEHIILFENKTKKEAEQLEILFIKILFSNSRLYGYNMENGGSANGCVSEETKEKISKSHKGKIISKETRLKMSKAQKGREVSDETRLKQSIRMKKKHAIFGSPSAKKVICDDNTFDSAKDCAKFYNVKYEKMVRWLTRYRNMPQKFIDLELHYFGEEFNKENYIPAIMIQQKIYCDEKIFENITECANYYDVNRATMWSWLNGKNNMPQEYIDRGLKYLNGEIPIQKLRKQKQGKYVIYNNIIFISNNEFAKYYNLNYTTTSKWLTGKNPTPQQYIDLGLRYYNPEVDGDIDQYEKVS